MSFDKTVVRVLTAWSLLAFQRIRGLDRSFPPQPFSMPRLFAPLPAIGPVGDAASKEQTAAVRLQYTR